MGVTWSAKPVEDSLHGFESCPGANHIGSTIGFILLLPSQTTGIKMRHSNICVSSEEDAWEVLRFLYDRVKSIRELAEELKVSKSSIR